MTAIVYFFDFLIGAYTIEWKWKWVDFHFWIYLLISIFHDPSSQERAWGNGFTGKVKVLMDDDGLNMTNWGYYGSPPRNPLGLQLMSCMQDRDIKPFFSEGDATSTISAPNVLLHTRDYMFSGPPDHMDYVRDTWINHRDKFLNVFPGNPYNTLLAESSASHHIEMLRQPDVTKDSRASMEQPGFQKETGSAKKRSGAIAAAAKPPRAKNPKKSSCVVSKESEKTSAQRTKTAKKSIEVVINGIDMDIAGIPIPVCSCTGAPQQCYRWGCGGWQSACCTTTISMYPLPMNTKRRGARIAGRKMSLGAFKKVLEKLAGEGYNFSNSIDLRSHWAKHGTNKFVTIR